jgi:hypothetical protein
MKTIKYVMTNTRYVNSARFQTYKNMKVCFAIQDEDVVIATVESECGRTLEMFGKHKMSKAAFKDMPEDAYDNAVFDRAAFALFSITL